MNRCSVTVYPDKTFYVRNLGWLLRNWKLIERFEVRVHPKRALECPGLPPDAYLTAYGERVNGRTGKREGFFYQTDYASDHVLARFLDRPVFRGLPIDWYGERMAIGDERYKALPRA